MSINKDSMKKEKIASQFFHLYVNQDLIVCKVGLSHLLFNACLFVVNIDYNLVGPAWFDFSFVI